MQERQRQRELRLALRAAARAGRVEDVTTALHVQASSAISSLSAHSELTGDELAGGKLSSSASADGSGEMERVRYLLAVQAVHAHQAGLLPGRKVAQSGSIERHASPPSLVVGVDESDDDDEAMKRPVQQHFGGGELLGEAGRALPAPLTLCKGCGSSLKGRRHGRGGVVRMRFTCGECGIAFETDLKAPSPDEHASPRELQGDGHTAGTLVSESPRKEQNGGIAPREEEVGAEGWEKWGLWMDLGLSRGMVVSGRRRMRAVVESVAEGSVAAAAGVQVPGDWPEENERPWVLSIRHTLCQTLNKSFVLRTL